MTTISPNSSPHNFLHPIPLCLKTLVIDEVNREKPWYFDETLKSQANINLITKGQLRVALGGDREISRLAFSPSANAGEYFTIGCAELYTIDR